MTKAKRRLPTWIFSEVEFERRMRPDLERISSCYHRAWRRCRSLPRMIPGLTETGLWECIRSAAIAAVRIEFAEDERQGRVKIEERQGLFLLIIGGLAAFRFNHVNARGLPCLNDTKQSKSLSHQGWLFAEVETDSTVTIVAGQRAEPSMSKPPEVVFSLLLDEERTHWSRPFGIAADMAQPTMRVLASILPQSATAKDTAVAAARSPVLRSKMPKRRAKPKAAEGA